jgi:hypothetical protein
MLVNLNSSLYYLEIKYMIMEFIYTMLFFWQIVSHFFSTHVIKKVKEWGHD